ncbi:MAG: hypothetical protein ABUK13_10195 [Gammaproteobacteria bacterium]
MISCHGKPLTQEVKKLTVSVKQYFDQIKIRPAEPRNMLGSSKESYGETL